MRRTFLIGVILLFFFKMFAYAQHKKPTLVGTWQYYSIISNTVGKYDYQSRPYWKKITNDGRFYQISQMGNKYQFSHEGTCYLKDDLYMEYITKHATDKRIIGSTSRIHYYFVNEDMVNFIFYIKGYSNFEVWVRVPDYIDWSRVEIPAGY